MPRFRLNPKKPDRRLKKSIASGTAAGANLLLDELKELDKEARRLDKIGTRQPLATLAQELNELSSITSQSSTTDTPVVLPPTDMRVTITTVGNSKKKLKFSRGGLKKK